MAEGQTAAPTSAPSTASAAVEYRDANELTIEGRAFADLASPFDRLPARAEKTVRPAVWNLSHDSAGMVVRFVSNSPTISAKWSLTRSNLNMWHMCSAGVSGIDLYRKTGEHQWTWVGVAGPTGVKTEAQVANNLPTSSAEYMLYLPLYNGVKSIEIGVKPGSTLQSAPIRADKPIVFYGTSITQGACASRPGMCHVAMLGRRFDRPVVNLGFSGNGRLEEPLADLLAEIDAAVYVIDCLPNLPDAKDVSANGAAFMARLRKLKPDAPVLLVESLSYPRMQTDPKMRARVEAHRAALREIYDRAIQSGDKNIVYLPGDALLQGDTDATVDGTHPTDLGFAHQADAFEKALMPLLKK